MATEQKESQRKNTEPFDIENLDLYVLKQYRKHPFFSWLFILLLVLVSIAPFLSEFFMEERLLTQADVYDTSRPLFFLHLFTDLTIGVSYTFITAALVYLTIKAGRAIPFLWAFVAFGVFIIACGMTHFMEAFVLWQPVYWVAGGIKWLTAVVSLGTAITIPFLVPKALMLVEISQVARDRKINLEKTNTKLSHSKSELEEKQEELLQKADQLMEKSKELERKTEELEKINNFMVGREIKMKEMKARIKELEGK